MPRSNSQIVLSKRNPTYSDVWRMYVRQSMPGFFAALCYTAAGVTGSAVANQHGVKAGAAFSLATIINGFVEEPCFMGMNAAISISVGHHNKPATAHLVGKITRDGILFGILLAVPSALVLLFLPKPILTVLNDDSEVINNIQSYFYGFAPSLIRLPMIAGTAIPWSTFHARTGFLVDLYYKGVLTSGLNFALGFSFKQVMLGLGLSPFFAAVMTAPLVVCILTRGKTFRAYKICACRTSSCKPQYLGELFKNGMPFVLEEMLLNATRFIRIIIAGKVGGNVAVAALGVAEQLSLFADAGHIEGAAQVIAANAYGRNNFTLIRKASKVALLLGIFLPAISYVLTPYPCIRLFLPNNEELIKQTSIILQLNLALTASINLSNIGTQLLRAQKDSGFPLWVNLIGEIGEGVTLTLLGFFEKLTIPSMYLVSIGFKLAKAIVISIRRHVIGSRNESTSYVSLDEESLVKPAAKPGVFRRCWNGLCGLFRMRPNQQGCGEIRERLIHHESSTTSKLIQVIGDSAKLPTAKVNPCIPLKITPSPCLCVIDSAKSQSAQSSGSSQTHVALEETQSIRYSFNCVK